MDILIEPDCYKVCRICMESCEDDFVCIYDEFEDVILYKVIKECARVEIRKNDALPRNACRNCAEYMIIAYHIIQKCRESDLTLRSIFKHELNLHHAEKNTDPTSVAVRCNDELQAEDMDPSGYEFLLADAYNGMILDGEGMLLGSTNVDCNFTSSIDGKVNVGSFNGNVIQQLLPQEFSQEHASSHEEMNVKPMNEAFTNEALELIQQEKTLTHPMGVSDMLAHESSETNEEETTIVLEQQRKCCGCRKLFDSEESLLEHCQSVHLPSESSASQCVLDDDKYVRCSLCYKRFSSQHLLKEHQRTVNRKYACSQCGKRFMTQANLDTHSKCHKNKETYKCCGCRVDFEHELDLVVHSQEIHRPERTIDLEKPFECDTCYRRYPTRKSLATHKRLIKQFQCQQCGAVFMKQLFLKLHLERAHRQQADEQRRRCCGGCREEFDDAAALRQHSERVHKPTEGSTGSGTDDGKQFECSICRKRFASLFFMLQHQQKVYREKCYPCTICGRTFGRAHDLSNHETTHSNEMPFECSVCGRRFKNKLYLKNHLKLHASNAKDQVCVECGKGFRTKDLLKTHLISHSQVRKYACTACSATFKRLQCLKIHMRVHTREKAFECTVCRKRYVQSSDLKRHMRTHNPGDEGKPFQCEYCLRRYPRKDYLKVHIRKQHLEKTAGSLLEGLGETYEQENRLSETLEEVSSIEVNTLVSSSEADALDDNYVDVLQKIAPGVKSALNSSLETESSSSIGNISSEEIETTAVAELDPVSENVDPHLTDAAKEDDTNKQIAYPSAIDTLENFITSGADNYGSWNDGDLSIVEFVELQSVQDYTGPIVDVLGNISNTSLAIKNGQSIESEVQMNEGEIPQQDEQRLIEMSESECMDEDKQHPGNNGQHEIGKEHEQHRKYDGVAGNENTCKNEKMQNEEPSPVYESSADPNPEQDEQHLTEISESECMNEDKQHPENNDQYDMENENERHREYDGVAGDENTCENEEMENEELSSVYESSADPNPQQDEQRLTEISESECMGEDKQTSGNNGQYEMGSEHEQHQEYDGVLENENTCENEELSPVYESSADPNQQQDEQRLNEISESECMDEDKQPSENNGHYEMENEQHGEYDGVLENENTCENEEMENEELSPVYESSADPNPEQDEQHLIEISDSECMDEDKQPSENNGQYEIGKEHEQHREYDEVSDNENTCENEEMENEQHSHVHESSAEPDLEELQTNNDKISTPNHKLNNGQKVYTLSPTDTEEIIVLYGDDHPHCQNGNTKDPDNEDSQEEQIRYTSEQHLDAMCRISTENVIVLYHEEPNQSQNEEATDPDVGEGHEESHVARITLPLKSANSSSSTVKKKDDCVEVTEKITKGNVEMPVLIPHMCYVCMIPFLKKVSLKKHLVEHTNSIPYTCNDCHTEEYPMVFTTPFTMNRHLQSHNYPHQCSNCPKRFINQRVLEVHEQSHTNANESTTMVKVKVECNDHPQQLESRSTHNSQVDLSPSSCKHCKKTFKTAQFLARHKCHSPDDMPHVCKHCNRRFNNKNIFIAHMQMHTPEEESKSSLPSSSSPTSSSSSPSASATSPSMTKKTSIARVTVISKKKKRYDCYQPGCEYNTMVYSRMFFHHRMHLKAFACDQCPKRFPLASLLAKHKAKQHMHKEKPTKRKKCNIEEEI
ncbi:uncharacterized protein LOC128724019 [Anopheles nili]|uniref:uncharacterized protein LOC128724019 n=1 Tax=Anopheles nili TaxID=185578 RepID=UPI00237BCD02|nr:uncharacterized protein LOC128724019 [Anopheles nili]